ncbi:ABC transporter substrate-binding protein [Devosia sp. MC521]|uniref:ABC transporter substrate-binding protein n=1 Tax=Devosia sp. MC521 TaxID=2759954 RepID=UPI0015F9CE89|nr:ABC transporter substrate-binding protein [Devosia sp. MC521]MBJ6989105.1 ABC transporter substrate-binding protein [Devosia sp. MC521]QMW63306.1 ABC transporter substrate-binding protein [Devosia sp. MC521]
MKTMSRRLMMGLSVSAIALGSVLPSMAAEPLKFWIPLALSGPIAVTGQAQQVGWQHAVDWINKEGGIGGRPVEVSFYDDEYKVELGVAGFKKAVADGDVVFTGGNGTSFIRAISPENNETYKVLMAGTSGVSELVNTEDFKYHFLAGTNYSDQVGQLLNYIKATHKGDAPARIAFIYSGTEFGRDPLEYMRTKAAELGIEVAMEFETKLVEVDVTGAAVKLRNAKPEYTIFHGYAENVWPEIVRLSKDYGIDTQFMGTLFGSHPEVVATVGDAANNYLGAISVNLLVEDTDTPMMNTIADYLKTWDAKPYTGYANVGYMQSWAAALVLREAIGNAMEKDLELNGENLIAEINAIQDLDTGGVFGTPIHFEGQRVPYGVIYRYNVEDGKLVVREETAWSEVE